MSSDVTARPRVLVVDDSEPVAALVARWLADLADVAVAHSGAEALQQAVTFQPHVLVVDILLPQMSGFEIVTALQRRRDGPQPQIIFITGLQEPANAMHARELGARAILYKPLESESVRRAVIAALYPPR